MLAEKGWNKRHLAKALAKIGGASLKPLIMVLADPKQPQDNREVVAETLGEIIAGLERPQDHQAQIKLAVDLLVAELNDRYNGIRSHIARAALTQISEVVSDQLIEAFANSDPLLRDQVAYILGDSKSQHLNPKLIRALSFANDLVASGAARVLYFRGVNPREHGYTGPL
jgi:HEAT repeat protein